jgi:sulfide:quinone oxidoreductase
MARVLVLGGGFGGIATAVALRQKLHAHDEVILVDRRQDFAMGIRKTWHILGISPIAYGTRQLAAMRPRGIQVLQGEITAIDPSAHHATINGEVVEADVLVVALGALHDMDGIPGLAEHGFSAWSRDLIEHARTAVEEFDGGRVVVGITAQPYSCPPAPFELALLLADRLEERGVDAHLTVFGPAPTTLPLLDTAGMAALDERLADRDIRYLGGRVATRVARDEVSFATHEPLGFDLLLVVPPHRVPPVLVGAGLAARDGWVAVDPRTLETAWPGVFAIGDCTAIGLSNGMSLPKAGLFAEREGEVVAQRIAATLDGEAPQAAFDGIGSCFVELGAGEASEAGGEFYANPPRATLTGPSQAQRGAKERFESERLTRWFGS